MMRLVGHSNRAYDCSRSPCAAGFPFHKVSSSHLADHHFFFGRVVLEKSYGVPKKSMVAVIVSCFFESQLQLRCHHKAWLQSLFLVLKKSFGVQKKIMLAVIVSCFFESLLQLRCHHKAWLQSLFLVNPPEKKVVVRANGHTLHS